MEKGGEKSAGESRARSAFSITGRENKVLKTSPQIYRKRLKRRFDTLSIAFNSCVNFNEVFETKISFLFKK
jgi:hypothetical protein